jgi:hypothetical protein
MSQSQEFLTKTDDIATEVLDLSRATDSLHTLNLPAYNAEQAQTLIANATKIGSYNIPATAEMRMINTQGQPMQDPTIATFAGRGTPTDEYHLILQVLQPLIENSKRGPYYNRRLNDEEIVGQTIASEYDKHLPQIVVGQYAPRVEQIDSEREEYRKTLQRNLEDICEKDFNNAHHPERDRLMQEEMEEYDRKNTERIRLIFTDCSARIATIQNRVDNGDKGVRFIEGAPEPIVDLFVHKTGPLTPLEEMQMEADLNGLDGAQKNLFKNHIKSMKEREDFSALRNNWDAAKDILFKNKLRAKINY